MYNSNVLKIRHGGGCFATCFGVPFLLSGLFSIASPWLSGITWEGGKPPPLYFILPFGAIFATVGGLFVFGRAGVDLDARRRIASVWWGLIFPIGRKEIPLPDEMQAAIEKKLRRSKNSTYWVYEVKLDLPDRQVDVDQDRDWLKARRRAEEVAKHLGIGMVDRSEGEGVLVESGDLDKPLAERLRESGSAFDFPPPPPNCRTKVELLPNGISLMIPARGWFPPLVFAGLVWGAVTPGIIMIVLKGYQERGDSTNYWLILPFCLLLVFLPGMVIFTSILRRGAGSAEVELDFRRLVVRTGPRFLRRELEFSLSEIEELILYEDRGDWGDPFVDKLALQNRYIRIVSDRKAVDVGRGLPIEELRWLHELLRGLLARGG